MSSFIWSTLDPLRMMQGCTIRRCQYSWHSQMCFKNLRTQIFWVIHAALLLNFPLEVLLNFNCDSQLEGRKVCYGLSPAEECIRIFGKVFFRCLPSYLLREARLLGWKSLCVILGVTSWEFIMQIVQNQGKMFRIIYIYIYILFTYNKIYISICIYTYIKAKIF